MDNPPVGPNPDFPEGPSIDPTPFITIFIIFAVLILAVGVGSAIAHQAKISDLNQNGKWIMATVSHVEQRTRVSHRTRLDGVSRPPYLYRYYVVVAHWTDPETGNRYIFSSDESNNSPRYESGDDIPVLVDRSDYNRYHLKI